MGLCIHMQAEQQDQFDASDSCVRAWSQLFDSGVQDERRRMSLSKRETEREEKECAV